MYPALQIRHTETRGRGLFAAELIPRGSHILTFQGWHCTTEDLEPDCLALQVGHDLWLCSHGDLPDDCANHSCEPNAGFLGGEPELFALRDIQADEEIVWDYSTSLDYPGWELRCCCGATRCRGVVRPWRELERVDRERLRPMALRYLRE